jgi:hypothetical protein
LSFPYPTDSCKKHRPRFALRWSEKRGTSYPNPPNNGGREALGGGQFLAVAARVCELRNRDTSGDCRETPHRGHRNPPRGMMLSLPQENGARLTIPNVAYYQRVLEAFGFDVVVSDPRRLTMERHFPDNNKFDGASQERKALLPSFAVEIQRAIKLI